MTEYQEKLRDCDGCHSRRTCRLYKDDTWYCISGPEKCWRKRKVRGSKVKR